MHAIRFCRIARFGLKPVADGGLVAAEGGFDECIEVDGLAYLYIIADGCQSTCIILLSLVLPDTK